MFEVIDNNKVLFDGLLFTNNHVYLSDLLYNEALRQGNAQPWRAAEDVEEKILNRARLLFLPSDSATGRYIGEVIRTEDIKERLMMMKGAIADERIPSHVVHRWVEEGDPFPCGNSYDFYYEAHYGRDSMLEIIRIYHFTPALPEIRKVILQGLCPYLKSRAIETITSLGGEEAATTLAEKIQDKDDFVMLRDAAATGLTGFEYASSAPALIRTFDETVYISPWDLYDHEKELWGGGSRDCTISGYGYEINKKIMNDDWLPMICLEALANIPVKEAMQTLERAARIDLRNTSEHARYCLSKWIDVNNEYLQKEFDSAGRISEQCLERVKELKRLVYDYDLSEKKKVYDTPFGMMTIRKKKIELHNQD